MLYLLDVYTVYLLLSTCIIQRFFNCVYNFAFVSKEKEKKAVLQIRTGVLSLGCEGSGSVVGF